MARHVLVIGDSMSLAHVARAMVAARRLRAEGCQVTFATGPAHQQLAKREGFQPRELYGVPPARAIAAIRKGSHVFDLETVKRYVASDLALIEEVHPDLIVADFRLSLNISAELLGMRYVNIVNGYMTRYYAAPQKPPETFPIVRLLGRRLSGLMFPVLKSLTLKYYAFHFNRYRRQLGLQPARDIFDMISSPWGNLIADLPEFIPCRKLPDHYRYVGPLIWEPDLPIPEWIDHLRDDVPTVYLTMGSTGNAEDFRTILITLRDAGYQVLTTTGGHLADVPEGVFATDFAPGSVLLAHSDAVVCHGGSLTIYQALRENVPIVGIATFHDQETNLDRVEALRWGVALQPGRWKTQDLLDGVETVCRDGYRQRARDAGEQIRTMIAASDATPLLSGLDEPRSGDIRKVGGESNRVTVGVREG